MSVREPTKAVIQNLDTGERITVAYNPTEYTASQTLVVTSEAAGLQFQTLRDPDFTVSLFFDTYELGSDVRTLTNPIAALQEPTVRNGAKSDPPKCRFSWGGFKYDGMLTAFEQKFIMFLPSGVPCRCEATLTFTAAPTPEEVVENAGLDNCRRFTVVNSSDRLDVLAWRQTGNPEDWRLIAAANGIDDPLRFPTVADLGRTLIIPDVHG